MSAWFMVVGTTKAANDTWVGKGNANWSVPVNWLGGVAPVANDALFFDGAVGLNPNNNFAANMVFANITFNTGAAPFVLGGNVLNLAGNITNNNSLNAQVISLPLALTGSRIVNVANRPGSLTLTSAVSETGGTGFGLTKTGNGLLTLSASNAFTGPVVVNGGTLSVAADTSLGLVPGAVTAGSIVLNDGAFRVTGAISINTNRSITLGGSGGTIDLSANVTDDSTISGAGNSLAKTGSGQLTLGGTNSYTGSTIVNDGTLKVDFTQAAAPITNIINSASPLVMSAVSTMLGTVNTGALPTFNVTGNGAVATTQAVSGVTFNNGSEIVSTTQTSAKSVLLALGGITRNTAGMVNFIPNGTIVSGVNAITTSTANDANGILGGWAAYNSTDYAANDGAGNIIAYPSGSYTTVALNAAIASGATSNVRLNSGTGPATLTAAGTTAINTLLQNFTTAETINIGAGQTLAFGAKGGVMIGTGKAAVTLGQTVGQGTITAGGGDGVTPGEINVVNFTASSVNFNSIIADNGSGAVKLSIGALGTTGANNTAAINAANTYSGGTVISSGRVQIQNLGAFGSGPVTILNNGQAWLSGATAGTYVNNFNISGASSTFSDTPSAIRFAVNNTVLTGTITLLSDAAISPRNATGMQLQGQITGNYNFTIGDGTAGGQIILFNTANNWSGNLLINSEKVDLGASEVIPNGAGYGDVILNNNASAILDLAGQTETINGLSSQGSAPFVRSGGTLTLGDVNATATFSGTIQDSVGDAPGTLNIIKIGSGVQTFSSANTYSGNTTVSNGTLVVSSAQTGAGAISVSDGATLGATATGASQLSPGSLTLGSSSGATLRFDLNNSGVATINTGSLTINGTATVNINSCPALIGVYPLVSGYSSGTITLGSQPVGFQGFLSINSGVINYNLTNVVHDTWLAGNGNWDATTANWTNALPGNLYVQGDFVQFDDTPAGVGPFAVSNAIVVQPAGIYVTNAKNYSISGLAITGTGGLIKDGSGSLTLSNVNTFTGPMAISAGQIVIGGAGQLGGGTYSAPITDKGNLSYNSSAVQTLSGAISDFGSVVQNGPGTLTLSGPISGIGSVVVNSNSMTLSANSSYSGGTTNNSGQITAGGNANAFGSGMITFNGGTNLLNGINIANSVYVTPGTTNTIGATANADWNNTAGGSFSGSGVLVSAINSATMWYTIDWSQFTGTYIVPPTSSQNIRFAKDNNNSGSGVNFDAHQADFVISNTAGRFGIADVMQNGIIFQLGSLSGPGNIQGSFNGANGVFQTLQVGGNNKSTTFSGVLGVSGNNMVNWNLTKVGSGTLTLSGQSIYIGLTTLSAGVVSLGSANTGTTSGPLGANAGSGLRLPVARCNTARQITNDYSSKIVNSTGPIAIDVNGTNVTFVSALALKQHWRFDAD